jgi:chromosome segregation ATPase
MRLEDLSDELGTFVDRAEAALKSEIEKAKKAVAALNAEKATAQKAVSELEEQREAAQKQLKLVLTDLNRASSLSGINAEITEARKTLDLLKGEVGKVTAALEACVKKRADEERQLNEVMGEMHRIRAERHEATAEIGHIRQLLKSI